MYSDLFIYLFLFLALIFCWSPIIGRLIVSQKWNCACASWMELPEKLGKICYRCFRNNSCGLGAFSLVIVIAPTWISWNFLLHGYKCTEGMLQKQLGGGGSGKIGLFLSFFCRYFAKFEIKLPTLSKEVCLWWRWFTSVNPNLSAHAHTQVFEYTRSGWSWPPAL